MEFCKIHPERKMFPACGELRCAACDEEHFSLHPVRPPLAKVVPVWDKHHGKWDLTKTVPVK